MADFFTGLAKRTMGFEPIVKPLLASLFTPGATLMKESALDADSLAQPSDAVQLSNTSAAMGEASPVDPPLSFPLVASTGQGQQAPITGVDFMVPGEDPIVQESMEVPFRAYPRASPAIAPVPSTADPAPISSETIPPTQRMPAPGEPEEKQIDRGLPDSPDSIDAAASEFKVIHSQVREPSSLPVHQPTSESIEALPHSPLVRSPSSLPASASLPGLAADHPGRIEPNLGAIAPVSPGMAEPQWQPQSSDVAGNLADSEGDPPPLSKPWVYPEIPQSSETGVVQRQTATPAGALPPDPQGQTGSHVPVDSQLNFPLVASTGQGQQAPITGVEFVVPGEEPVVQNPTQVPFRGHPKARPEIASLPLTADPAPVSSETIPPTQRMPAPGEPEEKQIDRGLPDSPDSIDAAASEFKVIRSQVREPSSLPVHQPTSESIEALPHSPLVRSPSSLPASASLPGLAAHHPGRIEPNLGAIAPVSPGMAEPQWQPQSPDGSGDLADSEREPTHFSSDQMATHSAQGLHELPPDQGNVVERATAGTDTVSPIHSTVSTFSTLPLVRQETAPILPLKQAPSSFASEANSLSSELHDVPTLPAVVTVQVGGTPAPETFATARSVTSRQYLPIDELTSATLSGIAPRLESVRATPGDGQLPHSLFEPDHPRVMQGIRSEPAPTIQVRIGRVEVRRVSPPPEPSPSRQRLQQTPVLSLSDYLRQREGGEL
jgi:hypothetical protein